MVQRGQQQLGNEGRSIHNGEEALGNVSRYLYQTQLYRDQVFCFTALFEGEEEWGYAAGIFGADDDDDIIDEDENKLVKKALEVVDLYCGLIMPQSVLYHLEIHGEDVEMHKEAYQESRQKR